MRLTSALFGGKFGNLGKVRGQVHYTISPFEQRAFGGAIAKGVPGIFRRCREEVFYVIPPMAIGYLIYDWANKNYEYRQTKAGMIEYGTVELIKKKDDDDCVCK